MGFLPKAQNEHSLRDGPCGTSVSQATLGGLACPPWAFSAWPLHLRDPHPGLTRMEKLGSQHLSQLWGSFFFVPPTGPLGSVLPPTAFVRCLLVLDLGWALMAPGVKSVSLVTSGWGEIFPVVTLRCYRALLTFGSGCLSWGAFCELLASAGCGPVTAPVVTTKEVSRLCQGPLGRTWGQNDGHS